MTQKTRKAEANVLKASIGQTSFKCGKSYCCCTKEGKLHTASYLSYRKAGKTYTVHIPKVLVKTVSKKCENWKQLLRQFEGSTHNSIRQLLQSYHNRKSKGIT